MASKRSTKVDALVAQIALDLEIGVEREGRVVAVLKLAAELAVQRGVRQIGDVRAHARDGEARAAARRRRRNSGRRCQSGSAMTAWRPTSWKAMFCAEWRVGAGDRQRPRTRAPDSSPPIAAPACRPSSRRRPQNSVSMPSRSSSMACARTMSRIVMTGKSRPQRLAGRRIGRGRPGRAHAAAEHIRADDEIAVGVDRLAGADHGLPPAGLAGDRMDVGDMLVAGQRVADQHRVGRVGVERAVGLVGDLERATARRRHRA